MILFFHFFDIYFKQSFSLALQSLAHCCYTHQAYIIIFFRDDGPFRVSLAPQELLQEMQELLQ